MSDDWEDEELTTIAPYRYERTARTEEDEGELRWSRISAKEFTPPPGLSRRQRRRWLKDTRKDAVARQKATNLRRVAGARGQVGEGLGIPLLVVAVIVAAFVFWPRGHHAPASSPAGSPAASSPAAVDASPTRAPAAPSGPIGHGTDAGAPPAAPAELSGPPGDVAYRFLLAFNAYDPGYPDPVSTWSSSWAQYATGDVAGQAHDLAAVLWGDITNRRLSVTADSVGNCATIAASDRESTWECDVVQDLFPIGGDASTAYTQRPARYRVTVTGTQVSLVAALSTGSESAAPSTTPAG